MQHMKNLKNLISEKGINTHQCWHDTEEKMIWQGLKSSCYKNVASSNHEHSWNQWKSKVLAKEDAKKNEIKILELKNTATKLSDSIGNKQI